MALFQKRQLRSMHLFDIAMIVFLIVLITTFLNMSRTVIRYDRLQDVSLMECLPSANIEEPSETSENHDPPLGNDLDPTSNKTDRVKIAVKKKSHLIDPRLKVIKDSRPSECQKMQYGPQQRATIIVHFNDYQFYDLKNTIGSLLLHGNMHLIEEIIVVDDASSLDYIVQESIAFFKAIPKSRFLRNRAPEQMGVAKARTLAAKEAHTNYLIFLDCWTICNKGWLEPLLDMLSKDPNTIAVPYQDRIHDPVSLEYLKSRDNQIARLSWNLAIRIREDQPVKMTSGYHHSPAIRGNVFAVRKDFFFSIGAYDVSLDSDGGGEHAELSIRAWLCTGNIKVVRCSRVGVLNLGDPAKVTSPKNVRRIGELWFGKRKSTMYRSFEINENEKMDIGSIVDRRDDIQVSDQCKDIDWYLTNIATNMVAPSINAIKFGILRIRTDRCSRLLPATNRVKLDDCKQEQLTSHSPEMLFELTKDGKIMVMGKCLTTKDNAYILAEPCRDGDTRQHWKYRNEELVNSWCNFCATHVTDPDQKMEGDRQIAMAQECNSDTTNGALFKRWEFLLP